MGWRIVVARVSSAMMTGRRVFVLGLGACWELRGCAVGLSAPGLPSEGDCEVVDDRSLELSDPDTLSRLEVEASSLGPWV